MMQSRLWMSAAIIAVVILVGFMLSVPHAREVADATRNAKLLAAPDSVSIKDSYRKGIHTISGTIIADNACATVSAEAFLSGTASTSQTIELALTIPPDSGICLQVPTAMPFSTTVEAPADVPISTTINGVMASTTIL